MSLAHLLSAPVVAFVVGLCGLLAVAAWMLHRGRVRRRMLAGEAGWRGPLPRSREFLAAREVLTYEETLDAMERGEHMVPWEPPQTVYFSGNLASWPGATTTTVSLCPGPDLMQPEEPEPEALTAGEAVACLRDELARAHSASGPCGVAHVYFGSCEQEPGHPGPHRSGPCVWRLA